MVFAMCQNGYFPKFFSHINRHGVPTRAIILNFFVGLTLFFPSPGWQGMVGFLVSAFVLCYAVGPVSVLALRSRLPNWERRFKLPLVTLWCYLALLVANLIVYWTGWHIDRDMFVAILIGSIILFAMHFCGRLKMDLKVKHGLWVVVYFVGMAVISFLGHFGGGIN